MSEYLIHDTIFPFSCIIVLIYSANDYCAKDCSEVSKRLGTQ